MTTPTRPLAACILVSPPGWRFWTRRVLVLRQLRKIRGLPRARRLGVNPARMDLRGSKLFDPADAAAFSRRQKRLFGRRREYFRDRYDALTELPAGKKLPLNRLTLGILGCALSHIEAWRAAAELPDDRLCLVVEDDALVHDNFDAAHVPWPPNADFVHLFSGRIAHYLDYSDALVRIDQRWKEDALSLHDYHKNTADSYPCPARHIYNWKNFNKSTVGYVVSGASARRLLAAVSPLRLRDARAVHIDLEMLYNPRLQSYALRDGWLREMRLRNSTIEPPANPRARFNRWALFLIYCMSSFLPRSWLRRLAAHIPAPSGLAPHRPLPWKPPADAATATERRDSARTTRA